MGFLLISVICLSMPSQAESCRDLVLEEGKLYLENILSGISMQPVEFTNSSQCSKVGETRIILRLPDRFFLSGSPPYQMCERIAGRLAIIASWPLTEVEDAIRRDQLLTILRASQSEKLKDMSKIRLRLPEPGAHLLLSSAEYQAYHLHGNGGPLSDMPELDKWHGAPYIPCKGGPPPPVWPLWEWFGAQFRTRGHDSYSKCEVRQRMSLIPDQKGCLTTNQIEKRQEVLFGDGKDRCDRIVRQAAVCQSSPTDLSAPLADVTLLTYLRTPFAPTCVRFSLAPELCRPGNILRIVELFAGVTDARISHELRE